VVVAPDRPHLLGLVQNPTGLGLAVLQDLFWETVALVVTQMRAATHPTLVLVVV
jgi:hypothetical protein